MVFRWLVVGALVAGVLACETGVAFERNVLSVPRSLMANADVALLKNFTADSLQQCMEQCCTGRFGSCSVASFKKNTTSGNCLHFYCRPLSKCKFQPAEQIDSFSFSSNPTPSPSKPPLPTSTVDLKNDNTTVKPRKGVDDDFVKSGIKPRKGVSLDEDLPLSEIFPPLGKSNVKARKGVELLPSSTSSAVIVSSIMTTTNNNNDDLMDLAKILADDSTTTTTVEPSTSIIGTPTPSTSTTVVVPTTSTTPTTTTTSISSSTDFDVSTITRNSVQSSTATTRTPPLQTTSVFETSTVPPSGEIEANHLVASTIDKDKEQEDEENDRRYKSSIHLVLSLVFGLLVLVAVLGVVAKRIYDGWLRRDYYRMNYLIDGIYNGVE